MDWTKIADDNTIERTVQGLKSRGIDAVVVSTKEEAKEKLLSMLPQGADVMIVTSTTLDQIGASDAIDNSGNYNSLRNLFKSESDPAKRAALRKKVATSDYVVGSVHAITEEGEMIDASASGSNIPYYSFTANKVIIVAGAQKIVKNREDGFKRLYEHVLPLESERVRKVYGMPQSSVNKILLIEKDPPGRTTVILVKEKLGF